MHYIFYMLNTKYALHILYVKKHTNKICINQLFMLPAKLLVNSKFLVRFWGRQNLHRF